MKYIILLLACTSLAFAGEESGDSTGSIHVDVKDVADAGDVSPVDGITSSGQPDVAALKAFANAGYVAVIDMRGGDEDRGLDDERAVVESLGMKYVPLPITDRAEISFDSAKKLDELLQDQEGPVLLHCGSGNRVGAMLALRHSVNGASDEESLAHGRDAGMTGLEGVVKERLEAN